MQKAAFYGKFLGDLTVDEIASRFSTSSASVSDHIRMFHFYELGRRLDLTGEAKLYWNPRNFPYSIIDRIFASPQARKLLRVRMADEGNIEIESDLDEFLNTYTKILQNVGSGNRKLNTRTLDTAQDIEDRIGALVSGKQLPKAKAGAILSSDVINGHSPVEEKVDPSPPDEKLAPPRLPKPKPQNRFGNGLFVDRLVSELKDDRLPSILNELQQVDPRYHNCSAILLRIALELAMVGWLKRRAQWSTVCKHAKNNKIGPMMSEMFNYVRTSSNGFSNPLDAQETNALKGLLDKGDLDFLNGWVHNPNFPSDPTAVQTLCTRVKPLLERLLTGK